MVLWSISMSNLQELGKKLLSEKKVDILIGYKNGLNGITPHIFSNPELSKDLVWNENCVHNLSVYLKEHNRLGKKIAITAKGCDVKSILMLVDEYQIKREEITIIGLECYKTSINGKILSKCKNCEVNKPTDSDELITAEKQNIEKEAYWKDLEKYEKLSLVEKEKFWKKQAEKCIRCYACRQACPVCFCEECYTDQTIPHYIDASPSVNGNLRWFHLRAFDVAGRCTGCRECDRACPVDIPWIILNKAAEKELKDKFGDEKLALFNFNKEDKGEFIL